MRIIFYGGRQAGLVCLLTLLAKKEEVCMAIAEDEIVEKAAGQFGIEAHPPEALDNRQLIAKHKADLLVCVHGRKIIKTEILSLFRLGGINAHPCLYKYKGLHPVKRLLGAGETKASVGVHRMTQKVDEGEVLAELFMDVSGCKSEEEVYNMLYLHYCLALLEALGKLKS